jgi:hypothetical protein
MFESMRYIQNSFSIAFQRQPQVRRLANNFEDILKNNFEGHYGQPQVIPIPDELDPEIPRMIFGSKHGFSQVIISQINMTLNVTYSPDWQTDIDKGRGYLKERVSALYVLLSAFGNVPVYFAGLTTRAISPVNVSESDLLQTVYRRIAQPRLTSEGIHDINFRMTTIVEDKYFNNISVKNYRTWKLQDGFEGLPRLSRTSADEWGIEIIGDFNDRYSFNELTDYVSSEDVAGAIIDSGLDQIQIAYKSIRENGGADV